MNGNHFPNHTVFMGKDGLVHEKPLPYFLERYIDVFTEQTAQFINAIKQNGEIPVTIEDVLKALIVVKVAGVSFEEGRKVLISELTP